MKIEIMPEANVRSYSLQVTDIAETLALNK